jgi:hypothetical protein
MNKKFIVELLTYEFFLIFTLQNIIRISYSVDPLFNFILLRLGCDYSVFGPNPTAVVNSDNYYTCTVLWRNQTLQL